MKSSKNQRILTFPDYISCLALTPEGDYLAVGSATYNQDILANVYIVDTIAFKVVKKLPFHTKGI